MSREAAFHSRQPTERSDRSISPVVREGLRSPGQPLDAATRAYMEPRFAHDFSHVRVHSDARAAHSARELSAQAYTVGHDTVFGAGRYAPGTPDGRRLLAHELAHVAQQTDGASSDALRVSDLGEPAERDAEQAAGEALAGRRVHLGATAPAGTLHRQPLPGAAGRPSPQLARLTGSEQLDGFALESDALDDDHRKRLRILAITLLDLLHEYPGGGVRITGHTDASGEDEFNEGLGQRRADAVAGFLIDAGVPASVIATTSAGERQLRVRTTRRDPRNRRVAVHFDTGRRGRSSAGPESPTEEDGPKTTTFTVRDPRTALDCASTRDCSAIAGVAFERQPATLRRLIPSDDPASWFADLADDRMALTSIFNRLCKYGLLCHVSSILRIDHGETPATILDRQFNVPGATPSVFFNSVSGSALLSALLASGHFCLAQGAGAMAHGGQNTLREISRSDSLHVSIGPDDLFDAHIDLYSPAPEHTGSMYCSNDATPEAVGHIGRELVPEIFSKLIRNLTGWMSVGPLPIARDVIRTFTKGFQVFPDSTLTPTVPQPAPQNRQDTVPPPIVSLTFRGPVKKQQRRKRSDIPPLPEDVNLLLSEEIPKRIRPNALIPPDAEREVAEAIKAAEYAGPEEEDALVAVRDAARTRLESMEVDSLALALDIARRMSHARSSNHHAFLIELGPAYEKLSPADRKYVVDQIREIAMNVRALLGERAGGVYKIWVLFGESIMWDFDF